MEVPVLHPGDVIHLAFPIEEIEGPAAYAKRANELYEETNQFYGSQGVTLAVVTFSARLDRPVIVAIFRRK